MLGPRIIAPLLTASVLALAQHPSWTGLREFNTLPTPEGEPLTVIAGATLIDGRGGKPVKNSVVVVRGGRIEAVGTRGRLKVPEGAREMDASGQFLLPGMLDAHFHTHAAERIEALITAGFTSFRDPGRPLPVYQEFLASGGPMPRAFLTGPHFDQVPHAHPHNAIDLQSVEAVNAEIDRLHGEGASAIKIYYRLPLDLIRAACERADRHGIPVTAHLELVRADDAIRAGLDGVEHVTSLGTALAAEADARTFEDGVRADNEYRRDGRYRLWERIDLDNNPKVDALLKLMLDRGVYLVPTLRPFAVEPGGKDVTAEKLAGFAKMQRFTAMAAETGIPVIVSSHGPTPEALYHEFELLVEAGLSPAQALHGAMLPAARFFGAEARLGSIEPGKAADLALLAENPLKNISAVRTVQRVMLNGIWVKGAPD